MVIAKTKPILPSLREKKRYLAFEIIAEKRIDDTGIVQKAIQDSVKAYIGSKGYSKAGIIFLAERYNANNNSGIIKANTKSLDDVKMSLMLIKEINSTKVTFKTKGVSGALKKANDYVIKREG